MTHTASTAPPPQESPPPAQPNRYGDCYEVLQQILPRVQEQPHDLTPAVLACRAYITLGLIGPAREVLSRLAGTQEGRHGDASSVASVSEIEALGKEIRRAPSGRVSWLVLQDRFERNCARLFERYPHLRRHDYAFRGTPRTAELFQTVDGNVHLSARDVDGHRRWLPDLRPIRQIASASQLPHDPNALVCSPYIILRDRFGAFLDRVFDATWHMFLTFSPRIYVLEPDLLSFAATLYVKDSLDHLCHERTTLFVGPECVQELEEHLASHPGLALPGYVVQGYGATPPEAAALGEALSRLGSQRGHAMHSVVSRVMRRYESLPAGHWERRYRPGEKLRVLGITSRFTTFLQHSMRDWQAAFERLGHEFRLLIEQTDHDPCTNATKAEIIDEWKPDLVVVIDHLRREYTDTIPLNLPYVCWIQDELTNLTNTQAGRSVGNMDSVCGFSKHTFVRDYAYPAERYLSCVIPTDPTVYDASPVPAADYNRHKCDISATTHASKSAEQMCSEYAARLDCSASRRLLRSIHEELTQCVDRGEFLTSAHIQSLVRRCEAQTGVRAATDTIRTGVFGDFASRLHDRLIRHKTLEWVGHWAKRTGRSFALYGNGWDTHPALGEFARGPVENGYDLRCVYQASTISLHVSGFGSVHQRLLDGLSSGGFFLVRHNPGDFIGEAAVELADIIDRLGVTHMDELRASDLPEVQRCLRAFGEAGLLLPSDDELPIPRVIEYLRATADDPTSASLLFPRFAEITFASEEAFIERAEFFLGQPEERKAIASQMAQVVRRTCTYEGFTATLLDFIRERLTAQHHSAPASDPL
ncbi:MAG: hypothetical protein ACE5HE_03130 [Phycisphaerae bacterium]